MDNACTPHTPHRWASTTASHSPGSLSCLAVRCHSNMHPITEGEHNIHTQHSQVGQHDGESLTWIAQLPRDLRARVIALRAFNLESLLIGEHVRSRERALAAIRCGLRVSVRFSLPQPLQAEGGVEQHYQQSFTTTRQYYTLTTHTHNITLAHTKPQTHTPIHRFQWWRDTLSQLAGGSPPPAHPVLTALWAVGREAKLSRYNLRRIIDTREEEFLR